MPLVSVIIPCYNVEQYIERCINSLIQQTIGLENLELIFIDDVSTDSTLSILLNLEKKYPDSVMIVKSPNNRKQGGARNLGIQYASCDYISFVDADDWVEPNMYEKLYSKVSGRNFDVVVSRTFFDYPDGRCEGYIGESDKIIIIEDNNIKDQLNMDLDSGVWNKLYKKTMIIDNNLWFPENLRYEDNYWLSILKLYVQNTYILEEKFYHYCIRLDSTVTGENSPHHLDRLEIELMKLEKYKSLGVFDICHDEIEINFLNLFYVNTLHILFTKFNPIPVDLIQKIIKITLELFPNYRKNRYLLESPDKFHQFLDYLDKQLSEEEWLIIAMSYLKVINNVNS